MNAAGIPGWVRPDEPVRLTMTDDGKGFVVAIGHLGERAFVYLSRSHVESVCGQARRLLAEPTRPAAAIRARVDLMLEDAG